MGLVRGGGPAEVWRVGLFKEGTYSIRDILIVYMSLTFAESYH